MALANIKTKIAEEDRRQQKVTALPPTVVAPAAPPTPTLDPGPAVEPPPPAPSADHALSNLISEAPPEEQHGHLEVDFAEEDTGKYSVRRVTILNPVDIQAELAKLRRMTTSAAPQRRAPPVVRRELDRQVEDLAASSLDRRQELRRKVSLDAPAALLKRPSDLRVRLAFVGADGKEEALEGGVMVKLKGGRRLERVTLHLDLELRAKD